MTLTPTQHASLAELIRLITVASEGRDGLAALSERDEKKVIDLAWELDRVLT